MRTENQDQRQSENEGGESYTHGYQGMVRTLLTRTATKEAAFFLPYLKPGMSLLDRGCGPGTITIGLAEAVSPGHVVGIEIEPRQVELAKKRAADQHAPNVRFEVGNPYDMSFPDGSFDGVFIHAVLEHLSEPSRALREAWRVLKRGGVLGLRHGDREQGWLESPYIELVEEARKLHDRLWIRNGGNPNFGRHQKRLLRETGFHRIEASASCIYIGTPDATKATMEGILIPMYEGISAEWIELGWTSRERVNEIVQACKEWGEHPDAFGAVVWWEAVGRKE